MNTVRFPKSLYRGEAVEQAVATYAPYGTIRRADTDSHFVVEVEASSDARARKLAGELGNAALVAQRTAGGAA
jgi:hypothetical protein